MCLCLCARLQSPTPLPISTASLCACSYRNQILAKSYRMGPAEINKQNKQKRLMTSLNPGFAVRCCLGLSLSVQFFCSGHTGIWNCLFLCVSFSKVHFNLRQASYKWNAYKPFIATWVHEKKIYLGWLGIEFQASLLMPFHLICAGQISHLSQTVMTAMFSGESVSSWRAYRGLSLPVLRNWLKT